MSNTRTRYDFTLNVTEQHMQSQLCPVLVALAAIGWENPHFKGGYIVAKRNGYLWRMFVDSQEDVGIFIDRWYDCDPYLNPEQFDFYMERWINVQ